MSEGHWLNCPGSVNVLPFHRNTSGSRRGSKRCFCQIFSDAFQAFSTYQGIILIFLNLILTTQHFILKQCFLLFVLSKLKVGQRCKFISRSLMLELRASDRPRNVRPSSPRSPGKTAIAQIAFFLQKDSSLSSTTPYSPLIHWKGRQYRFSGCYLAHVLEIMFSSGTEHGSPATCWNKWKAHGSIPNIPSYLIIQISKASRDYTGKHAGLQLAALGCVLGNFVLGALREELSQQTLRPEFLSLVPTSPNNKLHGHCALLRIQ